MFEQHVELRLAVSALAVHGVMTAVADGVHRYRLNQFDLIVPDGQPVRWALNLLHHAGLKERVYGPTLMLKTCQRAATEGIPIFLFGGTRELLDQLQRSLCEQFPKLEIAGMLLAIEQQNVTPDAYLPQVTFILYVIVILGGAGTILGPIVGAAVFQFLFFTVDALMVNAQANISWVGDLLTPAAAGQVKLVLVGVGMMVLMIFRPQGILGSREEALIDER